MQHQLWGGQRSSSLTNIGLMRTFIQNKLDTGFRRWTDQGLSYQHQLAKDDNIKTFQHLKNEFDLPRTYLQLGSFQGEDTSP